MKIAVLGAGSFGLTIANILSDNKHDVIVWTYSEDEKTMLEKTKINPYIDNVEILDNIEITCEMQEICEVEMVVYVVPSFALRETAKQVVKYIRSDIVNVICTKGIEADTMKTGYEILVDDLAVRNPIVILSGPTHAEELAFRKFTTIVSTSNDRTAREVVQKTFSNEYLRVYTQSDISGVEIMGGAKNVLAIAAGICDSHPNLGDNAKAALITRGLAELVLLGEAEGADRNTFYGLTGLGDLIVTATSKHSRNRKFGELLGSGLSKEQALENMNMIVEGLYSIEGVYELSKKNNLHLPIISGVYQVLYEDEDIDVALKNMFKRELKNES